MEKEEISIKTNKDEDIIECTDLKYFSSRVLQPYVKYASGYSANNIPPLYRVKDFRSQRFDGVRSCSDTIRGDNAAHSELAAYKNIAIRNHDGLKAIRWGWKSGTHYWNNLGGGLGSPRRCNGSANATFYVDFERPSFFNTLSDQEQTIEENKEEN